MITIENADKNVMVVAVCNDTEDMIKRNGEKTITLLFKKYSGTESDAKQSNVKITETNAVLEAELFLDSNKLVLCPGYRDENSLGEFCYRDSKVTDEHVKKAVDALKYVFLDYITDDANIMAKSFYEVISSFSQIFSYDCEFELDAEDKLNKLFNEYNIVFKSLKELSEDKAFLSDVRGWTYWKTSDDKKKPAFD